MSAVAFDDPEALLVDFLTVRLAARGFKASVATAVPAGRGDTSPARAFVLVELLSTITRSLTVEDATFAISAQTDDAIASHDLAQAVRQEISSMADDDASPVLDTFEVAGPYPAPDTAAGNAYRYKQTQTIRISGDAA